jgi:hypothetical protein
VPLALNYGRVFSSNRTHNDRVDFDGRRFSASGDKAVGCRFHGGAVRIAAVQDGKLIGDPVKS